MRLLPPRAGRDVMDHVPVSCNRAPTDDSGSISAALAFWACLALSAGCFAMTLLAPKVRTYRDLNRESVALQRTLVAAEQDFDALNRIADALEHDSDFASELARRDFGCSAPDERISVDPQLQFEGEPLINVRPRREIPWKEAAQPPLMRLLESPLLDSLAGDRRLRRSLLAASAILVLIAFLLPCDGEGKSDGPTGAHCETHLRRWLADRYSQTRP